MPGRFTADGAPALEFRLERFCDLVRGELLRRLPARSVAAIVLGGGYGRGEGGVLRGTKGDLPYNDFEFYVFLRGNRIWNEARHGGMLHKLGIDLSHEADAQVEFKIDARERWKKGPPSMFSYDLVAAHRMVFGHPDFFAGCEEHLDASAIPLSEATRLMFNRCSGLLLARALLEKGTLTSEELDFVGRNLAKMQLALGDATLTSLGLYHWSARERNRRLEELAEAPDLPWLVQIKAEHAAGLAFKLHPVRSHKTVEELGMDHRRLKDLALQLWLWLENQRLRQTYSSATEYALSPVDKCPETSRWHNLFVNVRGFGPKTLLHGTAWSYPRSRLCNALALLLWNAENAAHGALRRRVQEELRSAAEDWAGLVGAFQKIWPRYG